MSYPFKPLSIRELKRDIQITREPNPTGDEIDTETDHTHPERNLPSAGNNHNGLITRMKVGIQK